MSNSKNLLQNRYRLRTVLGTGGFSTIYLAIDETTGKEVSVKEFTAEHMDGLATVLRNNAYDIASQSEPQPVPDPSSISGEEKLSRGLMQIRREAEMLDFFHDVHGVPAHLTTFHENDTFYLVKEYLEGMTCREYQGRFRGRLPFTLALYIMKGTLEILQEVHDRGYIHCDISPINSFLCRDGGVYLIDWGVRHDLRRHLRRASQTVPGTSAGSAYCTADHSRQRPSALCLRPSHEGTLSRSRGSPAERSGAPGRHQPRSRIQRDASRRNRKRVGLRKASEREAKPVRIPDIEKAEEAYDPVSFCPFHALAALCLTVPFPCPCATP